MVSLFYEQFQIVIVHWNTKTPKTARLYTFIDSLNQLSQALFHLGA